MAVTSNCPNRDEQTVELFELAGNRQTDGHQLRPASRPPGSDKKQHENICFYRQAAVLNQFSFLLDIFSLRTVFRVSLTFMCVKNMNISGILQLSGNTFKIQTLWKWKKFKKRERNEIPSLLWGKRGEFYFSSAVNLRHNFRISVCSSNSLPHRLSCSRSDRFNSPQPPDIRRPQSAGRQAHAAAAAPRGGSWFTLTNEVR